VRPFGSTSMLGTGKKIQDVSEELQVAPFGNMETTIINSIDNSGQLSSKPDISPPTIPAPTMERGSLGDRTKHQVSPF